MKTNKLAMIICAAIVLLSSVVTAFLDNDLAKRLHSGQIINAAIKSD